MSAPDSGAPTGGTFPQHGGTPNHHGDAQHAGAAGADLLPAERGHLDSLDGLRAIAALVVLVFHVAAVTAMLDDESGPWQIIAHGDVGVPIFFALSGLLLYRPWVRWALGAGRTPDTRAYLWRRALRILPAYWAVVVVAMFAFNREQVGSSGAWTEWLALFQVYDLDPWWKGTGPEGLGQMWSLSTELTFYLLLPVIGFVLAGLARLGRPEVGRRAKRLLFGIALLAASSFIWVTAVHETDDVFYYELWLPKWMGSFAVGMALSVFAVWARLEPDRPNGPVGRFCRTIAFLPGACWLVAIAAWGLVATPLGGPAYPSPPDTLQALVKILLYMIIAAGIVAPSAFQPNRPTLAGALLGNPLMRYLGRISYGIFLWQFVVIHAWYELSGREPFKQDFWLVLAVVVPMTIAVSTVSYYVIEKPAMSMKDWVSKDAARWSVMLPESAPEPSPGPPVERSPEARRHR
jgi:peptidoglycan/LPS O-acetylase OafA/YrhL